MYRRGLDVGTGKRALGSNKAVLYRMLAIQSWDCNQLSL